MRGVELSRTEVLRCVDGLKDAVAAQALAGAPREAIDRFQRDHLPRAERRFGEWRVRYRLRALARDLRKQRVPGPIQREVVDSLRTAVALSARVGSLTRTQRLFALWHVFHLPLVWVMFAIVTVHVGIALYLGYWPSLR